MRGFLPLNLGRIWLGDGLDLMLFVSSIMESFLHLG